METAMTSSIRELVLMVIVVILVVMLVLLSALLRRYLKTHLYHVVLKHSTYPDRQENTHYRQTVRSKMCGSV